MFPIAWIETERLINLDKSIKHSCTVIDLLTFMNIFNSVIIA